MVMASRHTCTFLVSNGNEDAKTSGFRARPSLIDSELPHVDSLKETPRLGRRSQRGCSCGWADEGEDRLRWVSTIWDQAGHHRHRHKHSIRGSSVVWIQLNYTSAQPL